MASSVLFPFRLREHFERRLCSLHILNARRKLTPPAFHTFTLPLRSCVQKFQRPSFRCLFHLAILIFFVYTIPRLRSSVSLSECPYIQTCAPMLCTWGCDKTYGEIPAEAFSKNEFFQKGTAYNTKDKSAISRQLLVLKVNNRGMAHTLDFPFG